jgi:hypothetical protein
VGAEPAVQGEFVAAVVAGEDAVMKVVKIGAGGERLLGKGFLEAVMAGSRGKRAGLFAVEEEVDGMGWDNEMDQDDTEVEEVLDGMHGQPGPRAGIGVFVVQIMGGLVERPPVDEAVNAVEMQVAPEGDEAEPDREVNRMGGPVHVRNLVVGKGPEVKDFVSGPDGAAAGAAPEDVVERLVAKEEFGIVAAGPPDVVFSVGALHPEDIEQKMPAAVHGPGQTEVAEEQEGDPVRFQLDAAGHGGLEVEPDEHGDEEIDAVPGPQKTGIREHPLEPSGGTRRPSEQGRVPDGVGRSPLPTSVANAGIRRLHRPNIAWRVWRFKRIKLTYRAGSASVTIFKFLRVKSV